LDPVYGGGLAAAPTVLGTNVSAPTLITQVRPNYTPEAMQRKTQGSVILDVVVDCNGVPSAIRVARSLDPHGLDDEAVRAVPAVAVQAGRMGETPVDVAGEDRPPTSKSTNRESANPRISANSSGRPSSRTHLDRAGGMTQNPFGDRTQQQPVEAVAAVRPHDDEIGSSSVSPRRRCP
jgi:TonB family protein